MSRVLPSNDEQTDEYFTEWSGNFWYIWFKGAELECLQKYLGTVEKKKRMKKKNNNKKIYKKIINK